MYFLPSQSKRLSQFLHLRLAHSFRLEAHAAGTSVPADLQSDCCEYEDLQSDKNLSLNYFSYDKTYQKPLQFYGVGLYISTMGLHSKHHSRLNVEFEAEVAGELIGRLHFTMHQFAHPRRTDSQ